MKLFETKIKTQRKKQMAKNQTTQTLTTRDALTKALEELKTQRQAAQAAFKAQLDKAYEAYRKQTAELKAKRAALWAQYGTDMKAQKTEKAAARQKIREANAKAKAEKAAAKAKAKAKAEPKADAKAETKPAKKA